MHPLKMIAYFRNWLELEQILSQSFVYQDPSSALGHLTGSTTIRFGSWLCLAPSLVFYIPLYIPEFQIWFLGSLSVLAHTRYPHPDASAACFHSFQGLRWNPKSNLLFPLLTHIWGWVEFLVSTPSIFLCPRECINWTVPSHDQTNGIQVINTNWPNQHNNLLNLPSMRDMYNSLRIIF